MQMHLDKRERSVYNKFRTLIQDIDFYEINMGRASLDIQKGEG